MLSLVLLQLHLFKAALFPFPAPENIHSCASSQYPPGGLQATAGAPIPACWSLPDPRVTGGAPHALPHLLLLPGKTQSSHHCLLVCPPAQHWEHCWQTSHCWAQHVAPHKYFQLWPHSVFTRDDPLKLITSICITFLQWGALHTATCSLQQLSLHPKRRSHHLLAWSGQAGTARTTYILSSVVHWRYNCFRIASDQDELISGLVCPRLIPL